MRVHLLIKKLFLVSSNKKGQENFACTHSEQHRQEVVLEQKFPKLELKGESQQVTLNSLCSFSSFENISCQKTAEDKVLHRDSCSSRSISKMTWRARHLQSRCQDRRAWREML